MNDPQIMAELSRRLALLERRDDLMQVRGDGQYADVSYSGGVFTIAVPAKIPIWYGIGGMGPAPIDDQTTDSLILVNEPSAGTTRTVYIAVNELRTSSYEVNLQWWASDGVGTIARATATSDATSAEIYGRINLDEGYWFSVELENGGGVNLATMPMPAAHALSRFAGSYWTYIRSVGAVVRRLTLTNSIDLPASSWSGGMRNQVTLAAGTSGTVYAGRQAYDDPIALTIDNTGWAISRAIATYTVDASSYLTAFTAYINYFEPVLQGDTFEVEVVTAVNFVAESVTTTTIRFSGGLATQP